MSDANPPNPLSDVRARHPMTWRLATLLAVGGLLWLLAFTWMFSATFVFVSTPFREIAENGGPSTGLLVKRGAVVVMGLLGPTVLALAWWRHQLWIPAMWRPVR